VKALVQLALWVAIGMGVMALLLVQLGAPFPFASLFGGMNRRANVISISVHDDFPPIWSVAADAC
jgi:hypothetical protein